MVGIDLDIMVSIGIIGLGLRLQIGLRKGLGFVLSSPILH